MIGLKQSYKITKEKPYPPGGGVARRPPMDAGTMLSKE